MPKYYKESGSYFLCGVSLSLVLSRPTPVYRSLETNEMKENKDPNPLVSVVIPTVNRKIWVTEALESVLSQTFKDYEIIVIDDGSTDGTYDYLENLYGSRIKLFKNGGSNPPTAKNIGVSYARGKYIAILDDDDLWYPNKLERQVALMEESDQSVAIVGGGCDYIDEFGNNFWKETIPNEEIKYSELCIKVHMPGSGSNELIRRSVFNELGGFDNSLSRGEDRDFWIKVSRKYRILMIREVLCTIRIHKTARKGVDFDVIYRCRKEINRRIPERYLRIKADAWLYYYLFTLQWKENKSLALWYMAKSFLIYPAPLDLKVSRIKGIFEKVLTRNN